MNTIVPNENNKSGSVSNSGNDNNIESVWIIKIAGSSLSAFWLIRKMVDVSPLAWANENKVGPVSVVANESNDVPDSSLVNANNGVFFFFFHFGY